MSAEFTRIGSYRIIAKIGEGGMASVYLGVRSGMSNFTKLLVIKVMHHALAPRADALGMFMDEARIAARLNHANLVDTYEVGEDGGRPFIVMEYLQGQPYSAVLRRIGREAFSLAVQLDVLSEVLVGLHHVHELRDFDGAPLGLVHRDVSPQNVFINYDGRVKLVDFGIAKARCSQDHTRSGVIKGKLGYLSPEQVASKRVDRRADVFSVGVMLWEAIARRRFTAGGISAATIQMRIHGAEPRIRELDPDTPSALARICDRALEVEAHERFSTALEFQRELDAFRESQGHRVDRREVGRMIAQAFAAERTRIDQLIEGGTTASTMGKHADGSKDTDLVTSKSVVAVPIDTTPGPPPASRRRLYTVVMALSISVAFIAVFFLGRATSPPNPPTQPEGPPAASSLGLDAMSSRVSSPARINVRIDTDPSSARVWLDGHPLDVNPYEAAFAPDGSTHRVRVSAPGFVTQERQTVFDRDTHLHLVLSPQDGAQDEDMRVPDEGSRAPREGGGPPSSESNPAKAGSFVAGDDLRDSEASRGGASSDGPRRTIDPTDPYQ